MKLISLALVCTLCVTGSVAQLSCLMCTNINNPNCISPTMTQCAVGERCYTAYISTQDSSGVVSTRIYRDCVSAATCPVSGPSTVTSSTGGSVSASTAACCETDDCNDQEFDFPTIDDASNGKMCPGSSTTNDVFFDVVDCVGEQDTCFSGTGLINGQENTVGGCGSSNVCDVAGDVLQVPFIEGAFFFGAPTCTPITTTTTTTETTTMTTETTTMTTETTTMTTEPTTTKVTLSPSELLSIVKEKVNQLKILSTALQVQLFKLKKASLLSLHLQLLDLQQKLLGQQELLPFDHLSHVPLYYQQCLLVSHHKVLLHLIHVSLCGQQDLVALFQKQQQILQEVQGLLNDHHHNIMPYYSNYLQQYNDHYQSTTTAPLI